MRFDYVLLGFLWVASAHAAPAAERTICTITCMTDKDCDEDNRFVAGQAFCGPNGACVPLVKMGDPCQANSQCASKVCLTTGKCQ